MAHLRKRSNGNWEALVYVGRDAQGKRRYSSKSFARKRDAESWAAKQSVARNERRLVAAPPMTLGAFLQTWLGDQRGSVAAKTFEQRELAIRRHLAPALGAVQISKLTTATIQAAYARIGEGTGARMVGVCHAVLRKALNDARRLGLLAVNPALDATPPHATRAEQPHIEGDQLRAIIGAADSENEHPELWGAFVYLLASTGLRRGEALAASWADLDADAGTLRIARGLVYVDGKPVVSTPKTASSSRTIMLDAEAVRRLHRLRTSQAEQRLRAGGTWRDSSIIFASEDGGYLRNVGRVWARITKRAGVRLTLHGLRHCFATRALSEGVAVAAVAAQLGHSSPNVTYARYAHAVPADQRRAVEAVSRVLAG